MYRFNERLSKLITFDTIRICKLFEMLEYSFILLVLISVIAILLDKYYFNFFDDINDKNEDKYIKNVSLLKLFLIVFIDTFVIIVVSRIAQHPQILSARIN